MLFQERTDPGFGEPVIWRVTRFECVSAGIAETARLEDQTVLNISPGMIVKQSCGRCAGLSLRH